MTNFLSFREGVSEDTVNQIAGLKTQVESLQSLLNLVLNNSNVVINSNDQSNGKLTETVITGVQVGTGTGTRKNFNLIHKNIIAGTVKVFLDGVEQPVDSYSVNLNEGILTFVEAVPNNVVVSATYKYRSITVKGELLGVGNGTKVDYSTKNKPVVYRSEMLYVDGKLIAETAYSFDYNDGSTLLGTAPATGKLVTADYAYYPPSSGYIFRTLKGSSTTNSVAGKVITHGLGIAAFKVFVTLTQEPAEMGSVGEVYTLSKSNTDFKIANTGVATGTKLDYFVVEDLKGDNKITMGNATFGSKIGSLAIHNFASDKIRVFTQSVESNEGVGEVYVTDKGQNTARVINSGAAVDVDFDWIAVKHDTDNGESTFASTAGRTVTHNLNLTNYAVLIQATQDTLGLLGEVWIDSKSANSFVVKNTGDLKDTKFDWFVVPIA